MNMIWNGIMQVLCCVVAVFFSVGHCQETTSIRPSITGTTTRNYPCATVTCPPGKYCRVDDQGRPTCVCREWCYYLCDPVCGSDGNTYDNDCWLQVEACKTDKNITVANRGVCKIETECDRIDCITGRVCAIDENNRAACVCNEYCPYENRPVCGSDGMTYTNECLLQKKACLTNSDITVAHSGICDQGSVCDDFKCPDDRQCSVDEYNRPVCVCIQRCESGDNPVCGTDGKTYYNECYLKKESCEKNNDVTVAYEGRCYKEVLCQDVNCPYGKRCVVNERNETSCACNDDCYKAYFPVCGSNNRTYNSYCFLLADACKRNIKITVVQYGACSVGSACEGVWCPRGKHCEADQENRTSCVCDKDCSSIYDPRCGSDNVTYSNDCEFDRARCQSNNSISFAYYGRCEDRPGCTGVSCPYGRYCVVDDKNRPMCVCDQNCYALERPACGTDDKTYSNDCWMRVAGCMTNKNITLAHDGPCQNESTVCDGVRCPANRVCGVDGANGPKCVCETCTSNINSWFPCNDVCGSDNKTYINSCELRREACLTNTNVTVDYYGRCRKVSPCDRFTCPVGKRCIVDEDDRPKCECNRACPKIYRPVCGTDNKTYANDCLLRVEACLTNTNLTVAYKGKCHNESTCDGITCPSDRYCKLDEYGRPSCVCKTACTDDYSPVCGSDGKTYPNKCSLESEACLKNTNTTVVHEGECKEETTTGRPPSPTTAGRP